MAVLKRGPNLGNLLVRAKLPPVGGRPGTRAATVGSQVGFRCCKAGRRSCSLCPFTGLAADKKSVVKQIVIYHSGLTVPIREQINCRDSYYLYILSCNKPGCRKQYAGLTSRPLYKRFADHFYSTRDRHTTTSVGLHWQEPGHGLEHLEFIGVEKLSTRDKVILRETEKDLINRTGLISDGLNINL